MNSLASKIAPLLRQWHGPLTQELVLRNKKMSREKIREHISGNYCRCTGYQAIVDAIDEVVNGQG